MTFKKIARASMNEANKRYLYIGTGLIVFMWILMLLTGSQILVGETKVEPGTNYYVEEYGNVGDAEQASLVCNYFNGRKTLKHVFWYSPNNFLGKDSCPFLYRE